MKNSIFNILFLIMLYLSSSVYAQQDVLKVGVVPQFDARRIQSIWQPIIEDLTRVSNLHIKFVGSKNIPEFEKQLLRGDFDIAYMNPYHLIKANESIGYHPILRDTEKMLGGIIVVHKDSGIREANQLAGHTIAFPAPNALGASLLPRAELGEKYGISFKAKYVNSHSSVYLNVAMRLVDAGGGVLKTLKKQPQNIQDSLKVIHRSEKVSPHPIAVHPRLSAQVVKKIRESFIQLSNKTRGKSLLSQIPIKNIGVANLAEYQSLSGMGLDKYYQKKD